MSVERGFDLWENARLFGLLNIAMADGDIASFGTDDVSFTACSTTVGPGGTCTDATPVIRSYSTFSQAADENAVSRIYIGIHFRKAVETGVHHGRRIAAYAVHQFMKPVQ